MSYLNGIGGPRVPGVPSARNQQLQNQSTLNGIIRSAVWGQSEAAIGQAVPFKVTLNKLPTSKNFVIEILFNLPGLPPQVVGVPMILPATSLILHGRWHAMASRSGNISQGNFTFRVRVDNQAMISNELTLSTDPVVRAVQRNNSDGFDR